MRHIWNLLFLKLLWVLFCVRDKGNTPFVNINIFKKHRDDIECCPRCGSTRIRYNQPRDRVTNTFQHRYDYWDHRWHRDRYVESQEGYYQCNRCGKKWNWSYYLLTKVLDFWITTVGQRPAEMIWDEPDQTLESFYLSVVLYFGGQGWTRSTTPSDLLLSGRSGVRITSRTLFLGADLISWLIKPLPVSLLEGFSCGMTHS